jgi:hypothetical protein
VRVRVLAASPWPAETVLQMVDGWFRCATLPKCHQVRRRCCARIQRKRYHAGGEARYLDLDSLGAETRVRHTSMLDAGDVCERERGA